MSRNKNKSIPVASPRFYRFMYPILSPLMKLLFRIRVTGLENIPMEGGAIVCANHFSNADAICIGAVLPSRRGLYCLGKAELFSIPVIRSFVKGLGAIPVNRNGADVSAIRRSVEALNEGKLLAVFPQGTRQKGKNPRETPIKNGIGLILSKADVPTIPISISTKGMRCRLFRRIYITIGKPIAHDTFDFSGGSHAHKAISEAIFNRVCDLGNFPAVLPEKTEPQS